MKISLLIALIIVCIGSVSYYEISVKNEEKLKNERFVRLLNNNMMEKYPQKGYPIVKLSDTVKK